MHNTPIILNCLTNLERSSLIAVTITCILALESGTPIIISKFHIILDDVMYCLFGIMMIVSFSTTTKLPNYLFDFVAIHRCNGRLVSNLLTTEKYLE